MEDPISILLQKGALSESGAKQIVARSQTEGVPVDVLLKEYGFSDAEILEARQGGVARVPTRELVGKRIPIEVLQLIPEESARFYRAVVLAINEGVLEVGVVDPDNIQTADAVNFIARQNNMPFKFFHISEADFSTALSMYTGITGDVGTALDELESQMSEDQKTVQAEIAAQEKGESKAQMHEDAPMIKIVATILRYAIEGRASDIHIEGTVQNVRVRFRVDGTLKTSLVLPRKVQQGIVARIKVLSSMRLDERRKPQDGSFTATIAGETIDFRVSTFPTPEGEKVVIRILSRSAAFKSLDTLGFTATNLAMIRQALKLPYGIILISGPTGSGKSTTLYSMLGELDHEGLNIVSLEDPVEYRIDGVSQSQVRPEIGYTFAAGLRTTLRQDPDIIMVGEIRDGETAKLAVQAALTGHLVLSTIHTNNAAGVIPRLIDMGVDPYLIAPTLVLSMAQRLVKTLVPGTGTAVPMPEAFKTLCQDSVKDLPVAVQLAIPATVYEPEPSSASSTGLKGRAAVIEVFGMSKAVEEAIMQKKGENEIMPILRAQGMLSMKEDAMLKAFNKVIPYTEVTSLGGALLGDTMDDNPNT
jgi:type IV pilus assembly protein PilB